jgi:hypothetical protein
MYADQQNKQKWNSQSMYNCNYPVSRKRQKSPLSVLRRVAVPALIWGTLTAFAGIAFAQEGTFVLTGTLTRSGGSGREEKLQFNHGTRHQCATHSPATTNSYSRPPRNFTVRILANPLQTTD